MKNKFAAAGFFLFLLLTVCIVLFACTGGEPSDSTDSSDTETGNDTENVSVIAVESLSEYKIVRPDGYSGTINSTIAAFYASIKEKTGVGEISIKTDFYKEGIEAYSIGEFEILVGYTNRDETLAFLENMRIDDYGYALIGSKLVIAGWTEEATSKAISLFTENVLDMFNADGGIFYTSEQDTLIRAEYNIDSLSFGGINAAKFSIVYASSDKNNEKNMAQGLKSAISAASGYIVEVYSDKNLPDGTANIIFIGGTDAAGALADDEAGIVFENGNIYICGNDSTALRQALSKLTSGFSDEVVNTLDVSMQSKEIIKFDNSVVSAMSFNVLVSSRSTERTERVVTMVKNYLPDTVGFQETNQAWMNDLVKGLSDVYAYVGEGRDGGTSGEYNPIFYKKSVFNCLESGTKWLSDTPNIPSKYSESTLNRIYTYALLERKSDGLKIMVINTHLEHTSEDARNKQMKVLTPFVLDNFNYPMIITGDFNTTSSSSCYKTLVSTGVSNSYDIAKSRASVATFHNYGNSSKIIDFVFVNPLKITVNLYKVCDEKINENWASDHHPVYIEYIPAP